MSDFDAKAEKAIAAHVRMISGCDDSQTSADVSNVNSFQLPDPAGKASGACTAALLKVLYESHRDPSDSPSFIDVLNRTRESLQEKNFTQIPQLSSSRRIKMSNTFDIVPPNCTGTKRAVLIGINYTGQRGELSGCHNDVHNIKGYLEEVHGFDRENMTVLLDDGEHYDPTKKNIMNALKNLVNKTKSGDAVFVHYSGHGGSVPDKNGDEEDGMDETLIPVDYQTAGQIIDDDLYSSLVCGMPAGVTMTCLMDCCHSGTVMDLPYTFIADGKTTEMKEDHSFNFGKIGDFLVTVMQRKNPFKCAIDVPLCFWKD
eukprot:CAMPEP_0195515316 /NCGR_PEP_ID=MMETSP0794_2-20130614/6426_1 /TAXON_ID=515487 /ORGANISM="Stephanopyxis turris, Strain CCMP 815" /LENGTH=313 /DNA_ID=CAMNT_0040643719 /DNA_START=44 /DNA_END=985 /DNA_ORIENTATION=-